MCTSHGGMEQQDLPRSRTGSRQIEVRSAHVLGSASSGTNPLAYHSIAFSTSRRRPCELATIHLPHLYVPGWPGEQNACNGVGGVSAPSRRTALRGELLENRLLLAGLQLVFDPVPNGIAGTSLSPPVNIRVVDQFNNPAPLAGAVSISLGNNPSGASLSGVTTGSAAGGLVTFDPLVVDAGGLGWLHACRQCSSVSRRH